MALAAGDIITYEGSIWVNRQYTLGSLGIGLTQAPATKLEVGGVIMSSGGAGDFPSSGGSNVRWAGNFSSPVAGRFLFGDGTGWQVHFSRRLSGTTVDVLSIQDSGYVTLNSLSTASPSYALSIAGTIKSYLGVAYTGGHFSDLSDANDCVLRADAASVLLTARNSSGYIRFVTGSPEVERVRITNGGNVGIGTTTNVNSKLTFAADTVAAGGILFGTDTNLYRAAADKLRTDDYFGVGVTPGVSGFDNGLATAFSGDIDATLNGDVNDWNPTGLATATVIRVTPVTSTRTITGIQGGMDGRVLLICNVNASVDLILAHENTGSTTLANRIYCPNSANLTIRANGSCLLWYDSSSLRWRCVAV